MKTLPLVLAALVVATAPASATTLNGLRWHSRLLIVFAPRATESLQVQRRSIATATAAFAARDLRVIEVAGDRVRGADDTAVALRTRFAVEPGAFRALIVGKDGSVALRSAVPLATPRLVAAIDAMPMRRAELARSGRAGPVRR